MVEIIQILAIFPFILEWFLCRIIFCKRSVEKAFLKFSKEIKTDEQLEDLKWIFDKNENFIGIFLGLLIVISVQLQVTDNFSLMVGVFISYVLVGSLMIYAGLRKHHTQMIKRLRLFI